MEKEQTGFPNYQCGKHCPGTGQLSRQNSNPESSLGWLASWMAQAAGREPVYFLHPTRVAHNRLYGWGGGVFKTTPQWTVNTEGKNKKP